MPFERDTVPTQLPSDVAERDRLEINYYQVCVLVSTPIIHKNTSVGAICARLTSAYVQHPASSVAHVELPVRLGAPESVK